MNFMNQEKGNYNENEQIELEEQSIDEPQVTRDESEQLSLEKLQENADSEANDDRELLGEEE